MKYIWVDIFFLSIYHVYFDNNYNVNHDINNDNDNNGVINNVFIDKLEVKCKTNIKNVK
jgi:hypothetical protein